MKKFVMIFGPQAVGKMTVGQEIAQQTELNLLHNHMTLELLAPLYGFTEETFRLSELFRKEIFKSYAKSDKYGLIFTFVWAFNQKDDWQYVEEVYGIFKSQGVEVYFVELEADVTTRLERNETPHRLEQKPTKRNVEASKAELLGSIEKHRLNSNPDEITYENYLRINNTHLSANEVAKQVVDTFQL